MAKTTPAVKSDNVDAEAPPMVTLYVKGPNGEDWGYVHASAKEFKTGSRGYYANAKLVNPKSGAKYQLGANIILIGSKK